MKILIVGGGFGGVKAALELAGDTRNQITLITDKPVFQYYPALFSAATGHSHLQSWVPLETIFADYPQIDVVIDTIETIDSKAKSVTSVSGMHYHYETCILALGSVTTYFGIDGIETYAYGIKSAAEIYRLKQHMYDDIAENKILDKRYVIIGAGPTGVELAAAMGSYVERLCQRYKVKDPQITIDLIEAAPRVLPRMSKKASRKVHARLESLGVTVHLGKMVESATATSLTVSGETLESQTVIWTSGVANNPFYKANEATFTFAKNGRIEVDEHLLAAPNIYVIGDNACTKFGGLAQTALRDGIFVADNIKRQQDGKSPRSYKAVMPPVVVPVGKNWAIFEYKFITMSGWPAAVIRRVADFVGYSDILPFGQALGVWRADKSEENAVSESY